jgi:hypothetical protein
MSAARYPASIHYGNDIAAYQEENCLAEIAISTGCYIAVYLLPVNSCKDMQSG